MFIIEMCLIKNGTAGAWFRIWGSEDGADSAAYLKTLVENEAGRLTETAREYRMLYSAPAAVSKE